LGQVVVPQVPVLAAAGRLRCCTRVLIAAL